MSCRGYTEHIADAFIHAGEIAQRYAENKNRHPDGPAGLVNLRPVELPLPREPAVESVDAFLQKHKGPFPEAIVLDERRRSFLDYGVSGTPGFVLVDEQGNISSLNSGYRASRGLVSDDWKWDEGQTSVGE